MQHPERRHKTLWEDQRTAMLGFCGDTPLSPANAPILAAGRPVRCPVCGEYIELRWKVFVAEVTEETFLRKNGYDVNLLKAEERRDERENKAGDGVRLRMP